jgi:hypothetical protein
MLGPPTLGLLLPKKNVIAGVALPWFDVDPTGVVYRVVSLGKFAFSSMHLPIVALAEDHWLSTLQDRCGGTVHFEKIDLYLEISHR